MADLYPVMIAAERNRTSKPKKDLALTEGSQLIAGKPMAAEGKRLMAIRQSAEIFSEETVNKFQPPTPDQP